MQTSYRFLSRLYHSQKRNPSILSNRDLLFLLTHDSNGNTTVLEPNFTAQNQSFAYSSYTQSCGFFASKSSKRFAFLGLVSFYSNQNDQNSSYSYLAHRGRFLLLF